MDMDRIWGALGALAVLLIVGMIGVLIFAPKNVDYYYVSAANGSTEFCAYAHWTWHTDERAYCSDDKDKVLDFVGKANATIVKH